MTGWVWVLVWWLAFAGSHIALSSMPIRSALIERLGARGFQVLYSLVAFATFIPLVRTYWVSKHDGPQLWNLAVLPGVRWLVVALAGLAVVLLVLSFFQPSPTGLVPGVPVRARGVTRITRHALFMAIGLWGLAHTIINGFLSDVIFFGGFLVYALIGSAHQDTRKQVTDGGDLGPFYRETSMLPFAAILAGRNRLVASEIPVTGLIVGVALAVALYWFHPVLFG